MRKRVVVADDHRMFRQGLISLLKQQDYLEVVGEAEDGRSAIAACQNLRPDLVIMDVGMKNLNGIEATRQILTDLPNTKVIAVSMHSDRRFVSGMLEAGATAYILKDCTFDELTEALRAVLDGKTYLSVHVARVVVQDYMKHLSGDVEAGPSRGLTTREREVLQLFAEGKSTKEIASILHVSVKTIETHRKHIMDKLDLHSIAELTKWAVREGLTSLDQ